MYADVGIDSIACHVPKHYIDMADLAEARGVSAAKYVDGLGQERMAIATPPEDPVHLAVNAACKALERMGIDPAEIGYVAVGTETGIDHSKPIAVYLHDALKLRSNCLVYEAKHACFGATMALSSAIDWIASGAAKGSKALVVATDIARYGIRTPGEPTQGAGAVALVVSDDARLLRFDPAVNGVFAKNVMDFWRPLYRKDAVVDGHYSIDCYIEALTGAMADAGPELPELGSLAACLYHVPFPRMAYKAHRQHHEQDAGRRAGDDGDACSFEASYQERVAPWLSLNRDIGNVYTGSLYLAVTDLLRQGVVAPGSAVSLFSYGSGCVASMRVARLCDGYADYSSIIDPSAELAKRTQLPIDAYEAIMEAGEANVGEDARWDPELWDLDGADHLYLGNVGHSRLYSGIAANA